MARFITVDLGNGPTTVTDGGDVDLDREDVHYDGQRLTEARAEFIGLQAGEHLTGRPYLDPDMRPSVHVGFRVTQEVSNRLDQVAAQ